MVVVEEEEEEAVVVVVVPILLAYTVDGAVVRIKAVLLAAAVVWSCCGVVV